MSIGSLNSPIAWLLLVVTLDHIARILLRHFVKRDAVLERMI